MGIYRGSWECAFHQGAKQAERRSHLASRALRAASLLLCLSLTKAQTPPSTAPKAMTRQVTYNAGDAVWLRVVLPTAQAASALDSYRFTIRFAGDDKPVTTGMVLGKNEESGYHLLWKTPLAARAGRYEVDLRVQDTKSQQVMQEIPRICSFVIHRQVIQIVSADPNQSFYTSGDNIGCKVQIKNLTDHPIDGLRLEFSERYWPWIVQQTQKVGNDVATLSDSFILKPHELWEVGSSRCAVAKTAVQPDDKKKTDQPSIKQYSAVVWDHARKNVYAIALTPLVFVNPPGVTSPLPYSMHFIYPNLGAVNTSSYRQFHPQPFGAAAIRFETQHTMYALGADVKVRFSLSNPTEAEWRQITVRARLLDPKGKELVNQIMVDRADLNPHGPVLKQEVSFKLPGDLTGLYHVEVLIANGAGQIIAGNLLELGVNPLPKSVLLFCAHEDDDGTQMGFIRALIENQIPYHMVYFTSGDAGSCDWYFQHTCGPAEALDFGAIRMQEARAAMGHLGVPVENILFMGLPDGGSGKIWYEHHRANDAYLAVLLASDHAPYEGLFRPNLPFARDSVIEATEDIIKKFQPEVIFTVHPRAEGHIDHIVTNYFVVKALQELVRSSAVSSDVELRVDRIFEPKQHPATPYHYEDHEFYVSGEAMALAQEAGWFYQSQGGNRQEGNIQTWDKLKRSEGYRKVLDWMEHEGWNENE